MRKDRPAGVMDQADEERPPIFRTWRQWYAAILLELIVLIVVFRILTVFFE